MLATRSGALSTSYLSESCSCDGICSGYAHCIAIYVPSAHYCRVYCTDPAKKAKSHADGTVQRVSLESGVRVEMHDASLGEVGELLAEIANADIYVPADRIHERRTMKPQKVSLESIVRELDLMAVVRP